MNVIFDIYLDPPLSGATKGLVDFSKHDLLSIGATSVPSLRIITCVIE